MTDKPSAAGLLREAQIFLRSIDCEYGSQRAIRQESLLSRIHHFLSAAESGEGDGLDARPVAWTILCNAEYVCNDYPTAEMANERMCRLNLAHPLDERSVEPLFMRRAPSPPAQQRGGEVDDGK